MGLGIKTRSKSGPIHMPGDSQEERVLPAPADLGSVIQTSEVSEGTRSAGNTARTPLKSKLKLSQVILTSSRWSTADTESHDLEEEEALIQNRVGKEYVCHWDIS